VSNYQHVHLRVLDIGIGLLAVGVVVMALKFFFGRNTLLYVDTVAFALGAFVILVNGAIWKKRQRRRLEDLKPTVRAGPASESREID